MHKYTFIWKTAKFLDFGIHPHLDKPPLHAPALTKPGESVVWCQTKGRLSSRSSLKWTRSSRKKHCWPVFCRFIPKVQNKSPPSSSSCFPLWARNRCRCLHDASSPNGSDDDRSCQKNQSPSVEEAQVMFKCILWRKLRLSHMWTFLAIHIKRSPSFI